MTADHALHSINSNIPLQPPCNGQPALHAAGEQLLPAWAHSHQGLHRLLAGWVEVPHEQAAGQTLAYCPGPAHDANVTEGAKQTRHA